MSSDKKRWPRLEAEAVARELAWMLAGVCDRVVVAGSLRRGKALVGDVEILYIPRYQARAFDMFTDRMEDLAAERIGELVRDGVLFKRPSKTGSFSWGEKNRLAVHTRSGIPVDLFAATEENWWNYLVCRTGPAESNMRIARAAKERGWKWNPYGVGFSRGQEVRRMGSEEDVFRFAGLAFMEAEGRA